MTIALIAVLYIVWGLVIARGLHHARAIEGYNVRQTLGIIALIWPLWLVYIAAAALVELLGRLAGGRS